MCPRSQTAHERFETHLKRASVDYSVGLKYDTPSIFVGASISVSDSVSARPFCRFRAHSV